MSKYVDVLAIQLIYVSISSLIVFISLIGDQLLTIKRNAINAYIIALSDTLIHGFIGFFSWLLVYISKGHPVCEHIVLMESFICGLTASAIDLDHVLAARSFDLNDISHLPNRPFLHNTSLTLLISVSILATGLIRHNWMVHTYGWIFLTASLTHHLRDALRHGFWLYPFTTKPVPLWAYVLSLTAYPLVCSLLMDIVAKEWLERHSMSNHLNFKYKSVSDDVQEV